MTVRTDDAVDWSLRDREIRRRASYHSVEVLMLTFGCSRQEIQSILSAKE